MVLFEVAVGQGTTPSGYLEGLKKGIIPSSLRVIFSTITKIKQLQYIPVKVVLSNSVAACVHSNNLDLQDNRLQAKEFSVVCRRI